MLAFAENESSNRERSGRWDAAENGKKQLETKLVTIPGVYRRRYLGNVPASNDFTPVARFRKRPSISATIQKRIGDNSLHCCSVRRQHRTSSRLPFVGRCDVILVTGKHSLAESMGHDVRCLASRWLVESDNNFIQHQCRLDDNDCHPADFFAR